MTYPPPVDPYDSPSDAPQFSPQPVSPQPFPPQQVHPPTVYQHPGHGYPAFPPAPPLPPRNESRTVAITLVSAGIALTLLVGGAIVVYLLGAKSGNTARGGAVTASPSPSPSASPSPSRSPAPEINIREPITLNGYPKIEAEEFSSLTTDLKKELAGFPGAADAFGAVYGSVAEKKLVAALAAEVDINDPQQMLDRMFQSFSSTSQLADVGPASVGDLGGVAQCGSTESGGEDLTLCGWADEGSIGMFLFLYQIPVDVKGDFPDMRAEIETRS